MKPAFQVVAETGKCPSTGRQDLSRWDNLKKHPSTFGTLAISLQPTHKEFLTKTQNPPPGLRVETIDLFRPFGS